MTTVLVAVDESDTSVHAAEVAHHLFGDDATYLAINVAEREIPWMAPGVAWGGVYPWAGAAVLDEQLLDGHSDAEIADHATDTAAAIALRGGIRDATPIPDVGDPVEAICVAADQHAVDVIVVGHNEKGWLGRLLSGSVSKSVLARAHRPVLVVK